MGADVVMVVLVGFAALALLALGVATFPTRLDARNSYRLRRQRAEWRASCAILFGLIGFTGAFFWFAS